MKYSNEEKNIRQGHTKVHLENLSLLKAIDDESKIVQESISHRPNSDMMQKSNMADLFKQQESHIKEIQ